MNNRRHFLKKIGLASIGFAGLSNLGISQQNNTTKNSYKLNTRNLILHDGWDVIVVGGGPSGCAAAISSAREGAKTLLIEATGVLGGMGTSGLVPAWTPFSDGEKIIYKGIAEKIFWESKKGVPHEPDTKLDWVSINPEYLKRIYDKQVLAAGVNVLFFSFLSGVEMIDNKIDAILVSNKNGISVYKSKIFVDCTGDGDLSAWAGAAFNKGDEQGKLMPATHCFALSNVDSYHYTYGENLYAGNKKSPIWEILKDGKYSLIKDAHACNNFTGPGVVGFNAGHVFDVDSTNPESISNAMFYGREMAEQFSQALKEYSPNAFGNSFLTVTAPLMGIRESRIIEGDYKLTLKDWIDKKSFDDEIGRNCYFIDIHLVEEDQKKITKENYEKLKVEPYKKGESHGIPYRCLTPKGIKNLLIAGRSISTERTVQGSTRVQPVCLVTGEAAGMAAAHAAKSTTKDVHKIDISFLRKRLKDEGQNII